MVSDLVAVCFIIIIIVLLLAYTAVEVCSFPNVDPRRIFLFIWGLMVVSVIVLVVTLIIRIWEAQSVVGRYF